MPDINTTKSKHLTDDERLEIQECLDHGVTFKDIGKRIGKDPTTVSKEVKKHMKDRESTVKTTDTNGNLFSRGICPSLVKAPFVCNPCKRRHSYCGFQKRFYQAKVAQREYKTVLSEAREGIPLNKDEFYEIDAIVTKGIKQGQHLYHIMKTNNLKVSKSTLYRHLKRGYMSVAPIDMPRMVKFKARRRGHAELYVPKAAKVGRTYDDFMAYVDENDIPSWVEMDTVIGRIGGKTVMTLHFTSCNFMIGILLNDKTSAEVTEKIKIFKRTLLNNGFDFGDIFSLILTDNGSEFANIAVIENDLMSGEKKSSVFFCDPYKSSQKPRVEKNHTIFRDIVPKGESFDDFTQETVDLIFSHVNSVKRKSLNGKSPYEVFAFTYSAALATALGIKPIDPKDVVQSPKLLSR